eukprot:352428-Chlamydomonas_euryale.AAC.2
MVQRVTVHGTTCGHAWHNMQLYMAQHAVMHGTTCSHAWHHLEPHTAQNAAVFGAAFGGCVRRHLRPRMAQLDDARDERVDAWHGSAMQLPCRLQAHFAPSLKWRIEGWLAWRLKGGVEGVLCWLKGQEAVLSPLWIRWENIRGKAGL